MAVNVFSHDRINTAAGPFANVGIGFGGNAVQSIQIARHTPHTPIQAVGHLGIVDYTRGVVTSDVTVDCILVEKCTPASGGSSVYVFAAETINVGVENYVLTSFNAGFTAGQPATVNYGFLTASLASALVTQAAPSPDTGEESSYAVVIGDEGNGVELVPAWAVGYGPPPSGLIPVLNQDGTISQVGASGIPAGLTTATFACRINRDNVLDVRSTVPVQFITTYPLDITCDIEMYDEGSVDWTKLTGLTVQGADRNSWDSNANRFQGHNLYVKAIGFTRTEHGESVAVGQYLRHTMNFLVADLQIPLAP